jgi:hypothetical protein
MYVNNKTPFEFIALPGYDKEGREVLTNIIKGTFSISPSRSLKIPDKPVPITMADEYWGEPGASPLKYESDLAVFKPATDLILLGFAYHYRGKKIRSMEVSFGVGSKIKRATVECPEAADRIPLTLLENLPEKKSWLGSNRFGEGFGFYPKNYPPRIKYAGTYDETWRKDRAPFLPADFDYRFFQSAYPELITDVYLKGNERVFAENVSPAGPILMDLPGIDIEVKTVFEHRSIKSRTALDTLILEPENRWLVLVWRQMVPCHNMIKDIQGFEITTTRIS